MADLLDPEAAAAAAADSGLSPQAIFWMLQAQTWLLELWSWSVSVQVRRKGAGLVWFSRSLGADQGACPGISTSGAALPHICHARPLQSVQTVQEALGKVLTWWEETTAGDLLMVGSLLGCCCGWLLPNRLPDSLRLIKRCAECGAVLCMRPLPWPSHVQRAACAHPSHLNPVLNWI